MKGSNKNRKSIIIDFIDIENYYNFSSDIHLTKFTLCHTLARVHL